MKIKYSETAVKELKKIAKGDRKSASLILKAIAAYSKDPKGKFDVKVLQGDYGDFKRLDYKEYKRLKEIEEDKADYFSALSAKMKNKKWKTHAEVKKELGL